MKKIFVAIMALMMLLSLFACKTADDELTATFEDTQAQQDNEPQKEPESVPEKDFEKEPQKESEPQKEPEPEIDNSCTPENEKCFYIEINYKGQKYYHYFAEIDFRPVNRRDEIITFDSVDKSQLKPTDEHVTAVYYSSGPLDDMEARHSTEATVYTSPSELENNPHINVLAVKLKDSNDIKFFWSEKSFTQQNTLYNLFERIKYIYGYECVKSEDITSVTLTEMKSNGKKIILSDKIQNTELFEKLCTLRCETYIKDNYEIKYGIYFIDFKFKDESRVIVSYNIDDGFVNNTFRVTDDVKQYFLEIIENK